jgi:hypothetical protein
MDGYEVGEAKYESIQDAKTRLAARLDRQFGEPYGIWLTAATHALPLEKKP